MTDETKATYLIIDTETGGLDERLHPLLSISLLAVSSGLECLDEFHMKVMPEDGTLLQIPVDPNDESFNPRISHLVDRHGATFPCDEKGRPSDPMLRDVPLITAGAARINGFTWADWSHQSVSRAQADATFSQHIDLWFEHAPVPVAHNATFDAKFVQYAFPGVYKRLHPTWFCTCVSFRAWRKRTGNKGNAKLVTLAHMANNDPGSPAFGSLSQGKHGDVISKAHDALADTRMCLAGLIWLQSRSAEWA